MSHFIREITTDSVDLDKASKLAYHIWMDHYVPIVGAEQVTYMLDKFQSASAIQQQIENGFHYYLIEKGPETIGYLAIVPEDKHLFVSKYYVLKEERGKGLGKQLMQTAKQMAKHYNLKSLRLTVNRYNTNTIAAYEKMGFYKRRDLLADIGRGYVMDDYEMVLEL